MESAIKAPVLTCPLFIEQRRQVFNIAPDFRESDAMLANLPAKIAEIMASVPVVAAEVLKSARAEIELVGMRPKVGMNGMFTQQAGRIRRSLGKTVVVLDHSAFHLPPPKEYRLT